MQQQTAQTVSNVLKALAEGILKGTEAWEAEMRRAFLKGFLLLITLNIGVAIGVVGAAFWAPYIMPHIKQFFAS